MKIIEQSHQCLKEEDPLKLIELCGRTCYKSEDKITNDSARGFVKRIVKSGHFSVLEHAIACFRITAHTGAAMKQIAGPYFKITIETPGAIISANFRAWLEFFQRTYSTEMPNNIKAIWSYLYLNYPMVFSEPPEGAHGMVLLAKEEDMTRAEKLIHATRTYRFITNRGVTHEMVRHRPWAYSQESTRYVKYDGDMEFIWPVWCSTDIIGLSGKNQTSIACKMSPYSLSDLDRFFCFSCVTSEQDYQILLEEGWKAQQAREVLPNSLKTEIVCTAPLSEWKHMLSLRTAKAAHPQIRTLLTPVLSELCEEFPSIFKDGV